MRTRLKSVEEIVEFETDLDNKTATITFLTDLDIKKALDELAEVNNKMEDWSIDEQ